MKDDEPPPSYSEAMAQSPMSQVPQTSQTPSNINVPPPPRPQTNRPTPDVSYTMAPSSAPHYGYANQYNHRPPPHPPRPQPLPHPIHPQYSGQPGPPPPPPGVPPLNRPNGSHSYSIPWQYPRGYWCQKCHNTGRKLKNGKSCQYCWEKFAPRNTPNQVKFTTSSPINGNSSNSLFNGFGFGGYLPPIFGSSSSSSYGSPIPPQMPGQLPPKIVQPGDPSIGGILCGRCRGSGLVTFFLDEDLW